MRAGCQEVQVKINLLQITEDKAARAKNVMVNARECLNKSVRKHSLEAWFSIKN